MFTDYQFTVKDRFLKYVSFGTNSDETSHTSPSTPGQLALAHHLEKELGDMGIADVLLDEHGYVYGKLPANTDKKTDAIGFLAHLDTSSAVNGDNIKPIVHENFNGAEITLPGDPEQVITHKDSPELKAMKGCTIITSDGTSLLGADDKCGVAAIMDALHYLSTHPEVQHGDIYVCFNPDEEIAKGVEHINLTRFSPANAFTLDGPGKGFIESESFSADRMTITFHGRNIHPGYAKGIMVNSIKPASRFIDSLPSDTLSPETTEGREGYVHCVSCSGNEEQTTLEFIIRDFDTGNLAQHEALLETLANEAAKAFPGSSCTTQVHEQYRNMREVVDQYPEILRKAEQAMRALGLKPEYKFIRGGTDGSHLSFMGIPTPNLSSGQHSIHAKTEWACVEEMEIAVQVIVGICKI
ncbi:MAG: peptidase T [Candidatus Dojkabacteria bacterium]